MTMDYSQIHIFYAVLCFCIFVFAVVSTYLLYSSYSGFIMFFDRLEKRFSNFPLHNHSPEVAESGEKSEYFEAVERGFSLFERAVARAQSSNGSKAITRDDYAHDLTQQVDAAARHHLEGYKHLPLVFSSLGFIATLLAIVISVTWTREFLTDIPDVAGALNRLLYSAGPGFFPVIIGLFTSTLFKSYLSYCERKSMHKAIGFIAMIKSLRDEISIDHSGKQQVPNSGLSVEKDFFVKFERLFSKMQFDSKEFGNIGEVFKQESEKNIRVGENISAEIKKISDLIGGSTNNTSSFLGGLEALFQSLENSLKVVVKNKKQEKYREKSNLESLSTVSSGADLEPMPKVRALKSEAANGGKEVDLLSNIGATLDSLGREVRVLKEQSDYFHKSCRNFNKKLHSIMEVDDKTLQPLERQLLANADALMELVTDSKYLTGKLVFETYDNLFALVEQMEGKQYDDLILNELYEDIWNDSILAELNQSRIDFGKEAASISKNFLKNQNLLVNIIDDLQESRESKSEALVSFNEKIIKLIRFTKRNQFPLSLYKDPLVPLLRNINRKIRETLNIIPKFDHENLAS